MSSLRASTDRVDDVAPKRAARALALLFVALAALSCADRQRRPSAGAAAGGRRRLWRRGKRRPPQPKALPSLAEFADPRSVVPKEAGAVVAADVAAVAPKEEGAVVAADAAAAGRPGAVTVTVYLLGTNRFLGMEYSFFQAGALERYGTERVRYAVKKRAKNKCVAGGSTTGAEPCLVVGPSNLFPPSRRDCLYRRCRVMATNDERCNVREDPTHYGVRQYFSTTRPRQVYLPLGARNDVWQSLLKLQIDPNLASGAPLAVLPASQRKYVFNAIFSRTTNYQRKKLAQIIEKYQKSTSETMPFYASMAKSWQRDANNPKNDYVDTDHYAATLVDSVFTLSPAGKNPETFRLFEAVEAGSIPVMVRDEMLNRAPQLSGNGRRPLGEKEYINCEGSLMHWLEAPVVILDSWYELLPTLERLMLDVSALNDMQKRLRQWYTEYMNNIVRIFEDYMLGIS